MLLVAPKAQAKRVVERPYFLGSNNHKLEIERVTLDKKATLLDVKIYQARGDVGIDSHAFIMANGVKYDYHYCPRNSFNISKSNKLIVTHQNWGRAADIFLQ